MPNTVSSFNEWDPLEEVIVGIVDGAMLPSWNMINEITFPPRVWELDELRAGGGVPYPPDRVEAAAADAEEFVGVLESAGVRVRRPEPMDFAAPYGTPDWKVDNGFCAANPRDVLLVVGDELIEVPMADRGRYFETWPYRPLLLEYFAAGARWTVAPKPRLRDELYVRDADAAEGDSTRWITTEVEPTFDAADFVRCGRDLIGQRSHVTNLAGVEWLRRTLGPDYRVHLIEPQWGQAAHIDTTLMPVAPGKMLVNAKYFDPAGLPEAFRSWKVLVPPEPVPSVAGFSTVSSWISMNVLMLDEKRVIVERRQEPLMRAFEEWGFEPIPCSFENYYAFAGSFHCATLDVRRRGELQSYT
ncbi:MULTISPECIES: amidinotransferase [Actinomadura]|uniref:Amidinotransferase n=1 Tax=Actinomadura yumaensis TaxID=111807 RepID=A0ABW2D2C9_9ACTN|nr:amidinotransferase [Actinomadura sp. J1-007]MWK36967.1 amidinotransferase [Actinomadura sp. J1-007]